MRRVAISILFLLGLSFPTVIEAETIVQEPGASILLYHRFRPVASNFTTVTTENFEKQIIWLKERGFNFVKLSVIVDAIREGREPPAKSIAITVDDGHVTQYESMFPILKKHQVTATLFIYTDGISAKPMPNVISWDQLKEMTASGLVDIQAHSVTHPNFEQKRRSLSPDAFRQFAMTELQKSKAILEENLGQKISYFAWPYGAFDRSLGELAEKAGYEAAFGTDGAPVDLKSNRFSIPRLHVNNDMVGDRMASFLMPKEIKRTFYARSILKKQMPPRMKVNPTLSVADTADEKVEKRNTTRIVQSEGLVPPADIPSGN